MKICLIAILLALRLAAQEGKQHFLINAGSPEGQAIQAITQATDDAKKLALSQDFLVKYPKHEGAGWVTGQIQSIYIKQKEYDKAIDAGEQALANNPNDVDVAYYNLKAALGAEDADLVKKWAATTSELARKIVGSGKAPAGEDEKQYLEYVKGLDTYTEYALTAAALQTRDSKKILDLGDTLQQRNPKSQYMPQMSGAYLNAMAQSGQAAKACSAADKLATANAKDGEALLFAGDCALRANHADRAISLGTRALDAVNSRSKPEGVSDSDWSVRKAALVGRANWIVGVGYGVQQKFGLANKALRAALPAVKADPQLTATALFYLGSANYYLGKGIGDRKQMRDGLQYFEQCAAMPSSLQGEASKSARIIRTELGIK